MQAGTELGQLVKVSTVEQVRHFRVITRQEGTYLEETGRKWGLPLGIGDYPKNESRGERAPIWLMEAWIPAQSLAALVDLIRIWARHQVAMGNGGTVQKVRAAGEAVVPLIAFLACVVDRRRCCWPGQAGRRRWGGWHRHGPLALINSRDDVIVCSDHGRRVIATRPERARGLDVPAILGRHQPGHQQHQSEGERRHADDEQPIPHITRGPTGAPHELLPNEATTPRQQQG